MSEHTNNSHFVHRSYGLKELATLYSPNIAPASASTRLKHWIMTTPALLNRLIQASYRPNARILSPRQVDIILDEFGEP